MVICKFVLLKPFSFSSFLPLHCWGGGKRLGGHAAADQGQLLPSFLLADHLQIEKGLSSDIYYRENEYIEKLYPARLPCKISLKQNWLLLSKLILIFYIRGSLQAGSWAARHVTAGSWQNQWDSICPDAQLLALLTWGRRTAELLWLQGCNSLSILLLYFPELHWVSLV